jgi:hypothetical protein
MKRNKFGKSLIFTCVALNLISCSSIAEEAIRYECFSTSGLVIDEYSGRPIEGVKIQLLGNISRPTGNAHAPEIRNVYYFSVRTDSNGIYTIPALTNEIGMDWEYYEQLLIPKTGREPQDISPSSFNDSIPSLGLVIRTVKLRQEPIARDELFEQETNITSISEEIPSNSLAFYTAHKVKVEGGRFIDALGLSKARGLSKRAYIRPKPELVITHIKSFSTSTLNLYFWEPGFKRIAVKLFPDDARKLEILRRTRVVGAGPGLINDFVVMLGGKPTLSLWPPNSGSISVGYLYFPKDQDTHEVEQFLKNLVQDK